MKKWKDGNNNNTDFDRKCRTNSNENEKNSDMGSEKEWWMAIKKI